ncbi:unnamed protein product [Parascedosporium putredinis]|uniref:Uncharacterized protein n=1 Tax=Parascedosporium putredinis TaxID=1442378 RepID=A0A9P1H4C0_9PEZI|nr:unnamed protein product [Parascedosporium putredinis]CAI7995876.1 unnamed protein product [Parascedosporium putredinis]
MTWLVIPNERSRRRQRAVFIANYMSERGVDDEQSRQEVPQLSNVRPWGSSELSPRHHRRSWERPDAERQRRIEDRVREQARDQAAHEQGLSVLRRRVGAGILDGVRRPREARRARDAQQPHASTTTSGTSGSRQVTFGFDPWEFPGPDEDDDNNEAWDTLLTTLTPDPQPPSAGVVRLGIPRLILRPDFGREPSRLADSGFSGDGPRAAVSYTFSERRRHWRQMRDFAREIRSDSVERYTERIIDELNRIERRGGIIPDGTP